MALDGSDGGMRGVLNDLVDILNQRALQSYIDHVFYQHINVLSKGDNRALSREFFERFVDHMSRHYYLIRPDAAEWPRLLIYKDTQDLLLRLAGGRPAMKLIDESGMHRLLDELASHLDVELLVPILALRLGEQIELAGAYQDKFLSQLGLELDHPALVMLRWKETIRRHARIALKQL